VLGRAARNLPVPIGYNDARDLINGLGEILWRPSPEIAPPWLRAVVMAALARNEDAAGRQAPGLPACEQSTPGCDRLKFV
jgi:hypothetical protein